MNIPLSTEELRKFPWLVRTTLGTFIYQGFEHKYLEILPKLPEDNYPSVGVHLPSHLKIVTKHPEVYCTAHSSYCPRLFTPLLGRARGCGAIWLTTVWALMEAPRFSSSPASSTLDVLAAKWMACSPVWKREKSNGYFFLRGRTDSRRDDTYIPKK